MPMTRPLPLLSALIAGTALALGSVAASAQTTTPAEQLRDHEARAGAAAQPLRGQDFFTRRHGGEWSCASCHGAVPLSAGRHARTGKPIDPLAPAAHPQAFTDARRTEKWFRRNCQDVLQRECTPGEKADVLAWLIGVR